MIFLLIFCLITKAIDKKPPVRQAGCCWQLQWLLWRFDVVSRDYDFGENRADEALILTRPVSMQVWFLKGARQWDEENKPGYFQSQ